MGRVLRHLARKPAIVAIASMLLVSSIARADAPSACFGAFAEGQRLAQATKLVAAQKEFATCVADTACPAPPLLKDCLDQLHEVERRLGSIVIDASDRNGSAIVAVRLRIDGAHVADSLDGRALVLDPGVHVMELDAAGKKSVKRDVLVGEGEKLKRVAVTLEDVDTGAPAPAPTTKSRLPAYVVGAGGLAALGVFSVVAIAGQSTFDHCQNEGCDSSTHDSLQTERAIAFTALGVGVVALGVATVLWITEGGAANAVTGKGGSSASTSGKGITSLGVVF